MTECKFCNGKIHGENLIDPGLHGDCIVVQTNKTIGMQLAFGNEGVLRRTFKINFCPMCGQKLKNLIRKPE